MTTDEARSIYEDFGKWARGEKDVPPPPGALTDAASQLDPLLDQAERATGQSILRPQFPYESSHHEAGVAAANVVDALSKIQSVIKISEATNGEVATHRKPVKV